MLETETTDELLLASVATEPDAFAVFYRRHEDRILRYFLRRGATAELAADLTAEVFAAALVAARRFDSQGPAVAWLYGIARNTLAASRRRGRVEARARVRLGMAPVELSDDSLDRIVALEAEAAGASDDRDRGHDARDDQGDGELPPWQPTRKHSRRARARRGPAAARPDSGRRAVRLLRRKLPEGARDMVVEGLDPRGRVLWDPVFPQEVDYLRTKRIRDPYLRLKR